MAAPPSYSYRGTEYTFVDTPSRLLEELKCPICHQLVHDPVETSCSHLFCSRCIKRQKICPTCRKAFTTSPDRGSVRIIKACQVKCSLSAQGCQWQGDLGDAEEHVNKKCPHYMVDCSNGCEKKMERRQLEEHLRKNCTHRNHTCQHCKLKGLYHVMTSNTAHLRTCPKLPLPCPPGCGTKVERDKMSDHLKACPRELVACRYTANGCDEVLKRADMKAHESDDSAHIQVLLSSQAKLLEVVTKGLFASSLSPSCVSSLPLSMRPWLQSPPTCYPVPPTVLRVPLGGRKSFYSHHGGHQVDLMVDIDERELVVACAFGCSDSHKMPTQVTLLNQIQPRNHLTEILKSLPSYLGVSLSGVIGKIDVAEVNDKTVYVLNETVYVRIDKVDLCT